MIERNVLSGFTLLLILLLVLSLKTNSSFGQIRFKVDSVKNKVSLFNPINITKDSYYYDGKLISIASKGSNLYLLSSPVIRDSNAYYFEITKLIVRRNKIINRELLYVTLENCYHETDKKSKFHVQLSSFGCSFNEKGFIWNYEFDGKEYKRVLSYESLSLKKVNQYLEQDFTAVGSEKKCRNYYAYGEPRVAPLHGEKPDGLQSFINRYWNSLKSLGVKNILTLTKYDTLTSKILILWEDKDSIKVASLSYNIETKEETYYDAKLNSDDTLFFRNYFQSTKEPEDPGVCQKKVNCRFCITYYIDVDLIKGDNHNITRVDLYCLDYLEEYQIKYQELYRMNKLSKRFLDK